MNIKKVFRFLLVIVVVSGIVVGEYPFSDIHSICERYTQCRRIATLDERLCMGNSRSMPFWLPPRDVTDVMANHCHKALKPYYKQLEKLESQQTQQLLACLLEQVVPLNSDQRFQCHRNLLKTPKYDFNGDFMERIPTNCFQGIQRRIEKQCAPLKECCSSIESCSNLNNSEMTGKIKALKDFIKDYGKKCQLGLETEDLLLSEDASTTPFPDHGEHQPNGNLTVSFNTPKPKLHSPKVDSDGRILVRVITAEEELQRLRESGDEQAADKLEKELAQHEQRHGGNGISEIGVTVTMPSATTTPTTTVEADDDEDMWSTKTTGNNAGLEIASQPLATTTTITSEVISTTTSEPPPTTTTTPHLITDTPQPEPAEESQELLLNRSPPQEPSTKVNDAPKTFTTKTPFPVDDILKKYAHVSTLNKLVEQFRDQNSETLSKTDEKVAVPSLVDPEKLHKFYDRWESSIRQKLMSTSHEVEDPEAAQEYERLLKTLKNLRNIIYNN